MLGILRLAPRLTHQQLTASSITNNFCAACSNNLNFVKVNSASDNDSLSKICEALSAIKAAKLQIVDSLQLIDEETAALEQRLRDARNASIPRTSLAASHIVEEINKENVPEVIMTAVSEEITTLAIDEIRTIASEEIVPTPSEGTKITSSEETADAVNEEISITPAATETPPAATEESKTVTGETIPADATTIPAAASVETTTEPVKEDVSTVSATVLLGNTTVLLGNTPETATSEAADKDSITADIVHKVDEKVATTQTLGDEEVSATHKTNRIECSRTVDLQDAAYTDIEGEDLHIKEDAEILEPLAYTLPSVSSETLARISAIVNTYKAPIGHHLPLPFQQFAVMKKRLRRRQLTMGWSGVLCGIPGYGYLAYSQFPQYFGPEPITILGYDSLVVLGGGTIVAALLTGAALFSLQAKLALGVYSNRKQYKQRLVDFNRRLAQHRCSVVTNQSDDYYGENIADLSDYRYWVRRQQEKRRELSKEKTRESLTRWGK